MENKKSKTGLHIFVGILLGIIICGGVVFATYSLGYLTFGTQEENSDVTEEDNTIEDNDTTNHEDFINNLGFDQSKITNNDSNNYTLSRVFDGIVASLDESKTIVTIRFYSNITGGFDMYLPDGYDDEYFNTTKKIHFSKQLKDIYIGGFGTDFSNDTILFLMEDGTVEYLPIRNNLQYNPDNLKSYGALPELTDIVIFYDSNKEETGSTVLAQKSDGTIYDLQPIVSATGNYNY